MTQKQVSKTTQTEVAENAPQNKTNQTPENTDDLLDEIDAVLEENAELFVSEYRQQGGE